MKLKLNCTPHLRMHEITKKLFNNEFLSDIRFKFGCKILYAHSLELMKRSEIFEVELIKNIGKEKTIEINDCRYAIFFEFIKFLYTDDCEINHCNGIGLLKMATKYNVPILENKIINSIATVEWIVQLYDHCGNKNYYVAQEQAMGMVVANLDDCVKIDGFISIARMAAYLHGRHGRTRLISNISPSMIYLHLTNPEYSSLQPKFLYEWRKFERETIFETTFSVQRVDTLRALWIGIEENRKDIEIIITENNINGLTSKEIRFTQSAPDYWQPMLIALGKSIILRPKFKYTVTIKYLGIAAGELNVVCRMKDVHLIKYDIFNLIQIKSSDNMLEIILKSTIEGLSKIVCSIS